MHARNSKPQSPSRTIAYATTRHPKLEDALRAQIAQQNLRAYLGLIYQPPTRG
jgi:hypothetical protein